MIPTMNPKSNLTPAPLPGASPWRRILALLHRLLCFLLRREAPKIPPVITEETECTERIEVRSHAVKRKRIRRVKTKKKVSSPQPSAPGRKKSKSKKKKQKNKKYQKKKGKK